MGKKYIIHSIFFCLLSFSAAAQTYKEELVKSYEMSLYAGNVKEISSYKNVEELYASIELNSDYQINKNDYFLSRQRFYYTKYVENHYCDSLIYTLVQKYMPNVDFISITFDHPQNKYFEHIEILSNQIAELTVKFPNCYNYPEMFVQDIDICKLSSLSELTTMYISNLPLTNFPTCISKVNKLRNIEVSMLTGFPLHEYSDFLQFNPDSLYFFIINPEEELDQTYTHAREFIKQAKYRNVSIDTLFWGIKEYATPSLFTSNNDYINNQINLKLPNDSTVISGEIYDAKFEGSWKFYDCGGGKELENIPYYLTNYRSFYQGMFGAQIDTTLHSIERFTEHLHRTHINESFLKPTDTIVGILHAIIFSVDSFPNEDTVYNENRKQYITRFLADTIISKAWGAFCLYNNAKSKYDSLVQLYIKKDTLNMNKLCNEAFEEYRDYWPCKRFPIIEIIYSNNIVKQIKQPSGLTQSFFSNCVKIGDKDYNYWIIKDTLNNQPISVVFKNDSIMDYTDSSNYYTNTNTNRELRYSYIRSNSRIYQIVNDSKNNIVRVIMLDRNQFIEWDSKKKVTKWILNERELTIKEIKEKIKASKEYYKQITRL